MNTWMIWESLEKHNFKGKNILRLPNMEVATETDYSHSKIVCKNLK